MFIFILNGYLLNVKGISYMTEPIESRLRENLTERQSRIVNDKDTIIIPDETKPQIEDIW